MSQPERLLEIFRGGHLECFHMGSIAVVDEEGLKSSVGDVDFVSYYRSSSKPIQILPFYELNIEKKYNLTEEEISIMSGSLACNPRQMELIASIMKKAEISKDTLIMMPCYPIWEPYATQYIREGKPASKLYHNCIGKHLGLIMMQRAMAGKEEEYWKLESPIQQKILGYISEFTDVPAEKINVGWDGCGVPVFGVPIRNMALSYLRLAAPELIINEKLRAATLRNIDIIARHPENLMDAKSLCGTLCSDPNIIGKEGADGVYTFGLKKEHLGVAIKFYDGNTSNLVHVVIEILKQLRYSNEDTILRLENAFPSAFKNATGKTVGEKKSVFILK